MKKERNEELQSRREFFKNAAKGVLPILGAIALANMPLASIAKESKTINDCYSGCTTTCSGGCKGACSGCKAGCSGTCMSGCTGGSASR